MSAEPTGEHTETGQNTETMQKALNDDAAAWTASRDKSAATSADAFPVTIVKPAPAPRKSKAAAPKPVVPVEKKPFRMSYDGTTTSEHIQYMIDHGAR